MNAHTRMFDQEDGYTISVLCKQAVDGARWTIVVTVLKDDERLLPPRSDDDNSFESLDKAEDAGIALGRRLIAGLRR